jgi:ATP/maltotriose-dependent transcriptional regulator MalT
VDGQTSGESKQPHWALHPHLWNGPERAASAIVELGNVRGILTGANARSVRCILSRAWRMMLNLERREALALVDTVEPGLAELEPRAAESLRMEVDLLRATDLALQDDSAGALSIACLTLRQSRSRDAHVHRVANTICRWAHWKAADVESLHSLTRNDPGAALDAKRALVATIDLSIEAAVEFEQLRLGTALRLARDAMTLAEKFLKPDSTIALFPASIVARALYEGGHFVEAENLLRGRLEDVAARGTIETALRTYSVLARIAVRRTQTEAAYELLVQSESLGERRGWLRLRAASLAEQVDLLLREGRHEDAAAIVKRLDDVASQSGSTHSPAGASIQRYRIIAKSRLESARDPSLSAIAALRQLHHDAVRRCDFHSALQAVLWIVEGLSSLGERQAALELFERTLEVGATLGMYQMFIDCSSQVTQLLPDAYERAGTRGNGRAALLPYIGSLLNRWQTYETGRPRAAPANRALGPLSQREQHVLKLIGSGLSNKQIAQALAIAPETVKSHAKNIFMKLDVRTRTEAAMRAQQQGIL